MSNSLDPDQARHFVGPDLGSNCLQKTLVGKESTLCMLGNFSMVFFFICCFFSN